MKEWTDIDNIIDGEVCAYPWMKAPPSAVHIIALDRKSDTFAFVTWTFCGEGRADVHTTSMRKHSVWGFWTPENTICGLDSIVQKA